MSLGRPPRRPVPAAADPLRAPDAIEACETLIVRADDVATGAAAFVACPFVGESKMWQHYELVTRDFYVFHEIEELLP